MLARPVAALILFAVFLPAAAAQAQTAPRIDALFPPGGHRGTQVQVELAAEFLPAPCGISVTGDGIQVTPQRVVDGFKIAIDAQATPGVREVRIFAPQGGSSPFPFVIGDLPEVIYPSGEQPLGPLKLPVTVNGRLREPREIHYIELDLQAGRTLIAAAAASDFSSPLDPLLRLRDAAGKLVAESSPHRTAQSLLVFQPAQAGRFTLEIFDFQLAGSSRHIYRLTLTDGPWLDYAFPSGVPQHEKTPVTLHGWNLPQGGGIEVSASAAGTHELTLPGGANRLVLVVGEHSETLETEPNANVDQATELDLPVTVNGRFDSPGDVDVFRFRAAKGDRLAIQVASSELQFPADPVLAITNAEGKLLTELDDTKTSRDPSLLYTVPADGEYFIQLRDRIDRGGQEFVYRLTIGPPTPRLEAFVDVPAFAVHAGETANLAVKVQRLDGFAGALEVVALDLPPGVTSSPQEVPEKPSETVQLPLTAAEKLGPVSGLARIVIRSTSPDRSFEQPAIARENAKAASGSPHLWIAVSPEIPFTLSTTANILEAPRLAAFPFPVQAVRKEGFNAAIRLVGVERDRRGTVVPLDGEIAAESSEGSIPLIVQQNTTEGTTHRCRVMGVADVIAADGNTYPVFHVSNGNMSLGCQPGYLTMSVEPPVLNWQPGKECKVQIKLLRTVDMQPVTVRLEVLPGCNGLSCDPVVVSGHENQCELSLRFDKDVTLQARTDITLRATSSRGGLPIFAQTMLRLELR